jgi:hypothetical protein
VPLNNLINLNVTDTGKGVDADSITIKVDGNTVYTGDTNQYTSPDGECRRLGNKANYGFVYQLNKVFDYDQTVSITITATDLAGNVMNEYSYYFVTEMRSFGQNKQVDFLGKIDNRTAHKAATKYRKDLALGLIDFTNSRKDGIPSFGKFAVHDYYHDYVKRMLKHTNAPIDIQPS